MHDMSTCVLSGHYDDHEDDHDHDDDDDDGDDDGDDDHDHDYYFHNYDDDRPHQGASGQRVEHIDCDEGGLTHHDYDDIYV